MKHTFWLIVLLSAGLAFQSGCTKREDLVLATVGESPITVGDYDLSQEISPTRGPQEQTDSEKIQVLDSLIADRVLFLEGTRNGWDRDPEVIAELKSLEESLILDPLYREEVVDQVKVSDAEIADYYRRQGSMVRARHILLNSKKEAREVLAQLRKGVGFEEMAREKSLDLRTARKGGDLGFFPWGLGPIQKVAFSLKPGEVSDVFRSSYGYHILKVEERRPIPQQPFAEVKGQLRAELEQGKQWIRAQAFMRAIDRSYLRLDERVVRDFVRRFSLAASSGGSPQPGLTARDSARTVVRYFQDSLDVRDLLGKTASLGPQARIVLASPEGVRSFIENTVENDLLLAEARRRGIGRSPRVERQLEGMRRNMVVNKVLRSEVMEKVVVDSNEIREYHNTYASEFNLPEQVRALEILVRTEAAAGEVLNELKRGADFSELARRRSIHFTKGVGGDLGYFPRGRFPEIEQQAFAMKPGEVSAPIHTQRGFVILKVLAHGSPRQKTLEEAWAEIDQRLHTQKEAALRRDLVTRLKVHTPVQILSRNLRFAGVSSPPARS